MARISVDDQISEMNHSSAGRLGDLLTSVFSSLPPNKIVREILLNGSRLSQNGDTDPLNYPLEEVSEVQIRTADKQIWEVAGLDIALSCVERLQSTLIKAAELFRDDQKAEANQFFIHCVDGMERFLETILITRCAMKLDFNRINVHGLPLSQIEQEFTGILKTISDCQDRNDFIGIADKVEYELLTNLSAWKNALKQLRISSYSNS